MSKKVLFGSLDTLAILLFLSPKKYITSGIIRKQFNTIEPGTIYKKLKKLGQQGIIEKKTKKGNFAGDDRTEFKLTEDGAKMRVKLVERGLEVMYDVVNKLVKQKTTRESPVEDKKEQIKNFLMKFAGECIGMVDNEILKEQQEILKNLLNKLL